MKHKRFPSINASALHAQLEPQEQQKCRDELERVREITSDKETTSERRRHNECDRERQQEGQRER